MSSFQYLDLVSVNGFLGEVKIIETNGKLGIRVWHARWISFDSTLWREVDPQGVTKIASYDDFKSEADRTQFIKIYHKLNGGYSSKRDGVRD